MVIFFVLAFDSTHWQQNLNSLNSSGSKTESMNKLEAIRQVFLSQYKYSCISLQKYYSDYGCQLSSYQGCYVI